MLCQFQATVGWQRIGHNGAIHRCDYVLGKLSHYWRWAVHDFRTTLATAWPVRHRARRPSFRTLIADRGSLFTTPCSIRRRRDCTCAEIEASLSPIRGRGAWPIKWRWAFRDGRKILGK